MQTLVLLILIILLYYFLTRNYSNSGYQHIRTGRKQRLVGSLEQHEAGLLVALMAKVAKADGKVSELEAQLISLTLTDISQTFEEGPRIREELKALYNREKEGFENTLTIARHYLMLTRNHYAKRVGLMEYLLNLAFIDGEFSSSERMITEDIARALEVRPGDYERLVARFEAFYAKKSQQQTMTLERAYETLGVASNAAFDAVKKRYRTLVREYHPDVLMGKGAQQDIIDQATEKLQQINEAYELIKKHKG